MPAFNKFNQFVEDVANKQHDLKTGTPDQFKIYLSNAAPANNNTTYGVPADLPTGNGYTAGGASVGVTTGAQTGGVFKFTGGSDPLWTGSGAGIGPFRYAILYNASNNKLIGWWDYGTNLTITAGNQFAVDLDQVNGIFTLA